MKPWILFFLWESHCCVIEAVTQISSTLWNGGNKWIVGQTIHLSPSHLCLIFSFVFVLHVQFCKAKSRCTLSQVVHQQHSVTVSYLSLLQYSPPLSPFPFALFSLSLLPVLWFLTFPLHSCYLSCHLLLFLVTSPPTLGQLCTSRNWNCCRALRCWWSGEYLQVGPTQANCSCT